jgi:hypothetical protein
MHGETVKLSVRSSKAKQWKTPRLTSEDGDYRLYRNVGKVVQIPIRTA